MIKGTTEKAVPLSVHRNRCSADMSINSVASCEPDIIQKSGK